MAFHAQEEIPWNWNMYAGATSGSNQPESGSENWELGTKITFSASGTITALSFQKSASEGMVSTGSGVGHYLHLWNAAGTLIATASTVASAEVIGWNTAALSTPVVVNNEDVWSVSYTSISYYCANSTNTTTNGFLSGIGCYNTTGGVNFPNSIGGSADADVVFVVSTIATNATSSEVVLGSDTRLVAATVSLLAPEQGMEIFDHFAGGLTLPWYADTNGTAGTVSFDPGQLSGGSQYWSNGNILLTCGNAANDEAGIWLGNLVNGSFYIQNAPATPYITTWTWRVAISVDWNGTGGGSTANYMFGLGKNSSAHPTLTPSDGLWWRNVTHYGAAANWTVESPAGAQSTSFGYPAVVSDSAASYHTYKITYNSSTNAITMTQDGVNVSTVPSYTASAPLTPFMWVINTSAGTGQSVLLCDWFHATIPFLAP